MTHPHQKSTFKFLNAMKCLSFVIAFLISFSQIFAFVNRGFKEIHWFGLYFIVFLVLGILTLLNNRVAAVLLFIAFLLGTLQWNFYFWPTHGFNDFGYVVIAVLIPGLIFLLGAVATFVQHEKK